MVVRCGWRSELFALSLSPSDQVQEVGDQGHRERKLADSAQHITRAQNTIIWQRTAAALLFLRKDTSHGLRRSLGWLSTTNCGCPPRPDGKREGCSVRKIFRRILSWCRCRGRWVGYTTYRYSLCLTKNPFKYSNTVRYRVTTIHTAAVVPPAGRSRQSARVTLHASLRSILCVHVRFLTYM